MPIHLALEGEHLAAFTHAICNQLADDHIQITDHLKDHSRLMSEVLGEPAGTSLDATRLITHLRCMRGEVDLHQKLLSNEKDKGVKLLTEAKAETERVWAVHNLQCGRATRLLKAIDKAVCLLGKRNFSTPDRKKVVELLTDALESQ